MKISKFIAKPLYHFYFQKQIDIKQTFFSFCAKKLFKNTPKNVIVIKYHIQIIELGGF